MRPLPIVIAWGAVVAVLGALLVNLIDAQGIASLINLVILVVCGLLASAVDRERFWGPRDPRKLQ